MATRQSFLTKSRYFNNWSLFAIVVVPMSIAVIVAMTTVDLTAPSAISALITFSVRLAVPWLYIAFAASSLVVVFPGALWPWV